MTTELSAVHAPDNARDAEIGGRLVRQAVPLVVGMLFLTFQSFINALCVSALGTQALAAVGYAGPLVQIAGSLFIALGTGVTTHIESTAQFDKLEPNIAHPREQRSRLAAASRCTASKRQGCA